ncbi:MAG: hypothetical protein ACKOAD_02730 [Gammaproteobacteria bacterium]
MEIRPISSMNEIASDDQLNVLKNELRRTKDALSLALEYSKGLELDLEHALGQLMLLQQRAA